MIKKIFHSADWHIRNHDRHEEFEESFKLFLESVLTGNLTYNEGIICITGDLFETQDQVSNEANLIVVKALKRCLEAHRVVVIIGNHDLPRNRFRLDAITPIVEAIGDSNLKYSKISESFKIDNLCFTHYSFLDNFNIRSPLKKDVSKKYIGLYHAPLKNCKNPLNFVFEKKMQEYETDIKLFEGCDVVLMGDIHFPQKIQSGSFAAYYCGSLYQQNFGEYVDHHGFGILDVETLDYEFIPIINSYGKYKIKIFSPSTDIKNLTFTNIKQL
jgi:DNA repair exonuclease SbcCD nuclease subunit